MAWYVPDLTNAADLAKVRRKALLKEFWDSCATGKGKLKVSVWKPSGLDSTSAGKPAISRPSCLLVSACRKLFFRKTRHC